MLAFVILDYLFVLIYILKPSCLLLFTFQICNLKFEYFTLLPFILLCTVYVLLKIFLLTFGGGVRSHGCRPSDFFRNASFK